MSGPRGRQYGTPLSPQQETVLLLLADGGTPTTIGSELYIAPSTVSAVTTNIRAKLGATTIPHAIAIAYQKGLLQ